MAELPNLAGVAYKELVQKIGTGKFQADYISWARIARLMHTHAPGWMAYAKINPESNNLLWPAPEGSMLMMGLVHLDGTTTPLVPQAVMDYRNSSIPFDKITARDVTDTERRGSAMIVARFTGLGSELWADMELESGYNMQSVEGDKMVVEGLKEGAGKAKTDTQKAKGQAPNDKFRGRKDVTEKDFQELALHRGFTTEAIEMLILKLKDNGKTIRHGYDFLLDCDDEVVKLKNLEYSQKPEVKQYRVDESTESGKDW